MRLRGSTPEGEYSSRWDDHPSGLINGQPSLLRVTHLQGPDASVLCRTVTCATCVASRGPSEKPPLR